MGVGEAWLFLGFERSALLIRKTSTFITSRPLSTSKARARSEAPLPLVAVGTQTRPPATTGDDHPRPGIGVFQMTLRDSLHSTGTPRSVECPWPVGPRNCGQSSALAAAPGNATPIGPSRREIGVAL